jgi:hypothetical protein
VSVTVAIVAAATLLSSRVVAQSSAAAPAAPARYLVARDTLSYELDNPFRLYWVRGADTVGAPQHQHSVETHAWRGPTAHPEVVIRQVALDVGRRTTVDTFTLAPDGRVETIGHRQPTSAQRTDLLLRLPASSLTVGTRWSDTVRSAGTDPGGAQGYEVARTYRVVRRVDTLGVRGVADVAAQGTVRYRFGFWVDSAAGRAAWVDVAGPVTEHYLFDVARGRLLRRQWAMDLRGRGVSPAGADTVIAGLRSEETLALADSPRLRFLLAPLPGADTSVSFDTERGAAVLLHTVARAPDRIASSLTRNDGMVGVASVAFAAPGGRPRAYEATWADSAPALRTQRVSVRGDSLLVHRSGVRDTAVAIPAADTAWGVAGYAMEELLTPALLAVTRDGAPHPFAVFRPFPGRWDAVTARAQERAGLVIVVLGFEGAKDPEVLLLTPDGDLLFSENAGLQHSRRGPTNAARQARLAAALKEINASGGNAERR